MRQWHIDKTPSMPEYNELILLPHSLICVTYFKANIVCFLSYLSSFVFAKLFIAFLLVNKCAKGTSQRTRNCIITQKRIESGLTSIPYYSIAHTHRSESHHHHYVLACLVFEANNANQVSFDYIFCSNYRLLCIQ